MGVLGGVLEQRQMEHLKARAVVVKDEDITGTVWLTADFSRVVMIATVQWNGIFSVLKGNNCLEILYPEKASLKSVFRQIKTKE